MNAVCRVHFVVTIKQWKVLVVCRLRINESGSSKVNFLSGGCFLLFGGCFLLSGGGLLLFGRCSLFVGVYSFFSSRHSYSFHSKKFLC